ncbi:torsin-1A-interacting protein 1 isoform X2 [Salminus brasiliensis]|uniref:torsin-1A-interacting protein 1 isoform X2 n=1 Tax=Salminus brasiliensis TaxID=930266 RepID=UPI003B83259B
MNEDTTLPERNNVEVDHLQRKTKEGMEDEDQDEVTPAAGSISSSDKEISEEEENTQGEDAKQPEHNDERTEQLQEKDKKAPNLQPEASSNITISKHLQMMDGAEDVQSVREGTDKKSKSETDHASKQVIPQVRSPSKERIKDVSNETPESTSSVKEEEPNKPFKEHLGEGDAPPNTEARASITAQDTTDTKYNLFYIGATFTTVIAVLAIWFLGAEPPPVQKTFNLVDVFRHEMDKVQSSFPSQHKELWRRSRIHLQRHLQMSHPSEPVSLILTSGRGAEKTLGCLAQRLAAAFSTARNASALDIDGLSKTTEDSDQVKLDIDKALREAFDGGKQAVVIHRFEELPPGSTLIFYRYCDHENAAYKNVFLAFTVLLEEELEVPPNVSLGMVEEVVQDYLKEKFVSSDRTAMFNQMDVDKLSGLWSRISHLILPVSAEETVEQHGCGESG